MKKQKNKRKSVDKTELNIPCRDLGEADHEGWLTKKAGGHGIVPIMWKRYWCVVKDGKLFCYKTSFDIAADYLLIVNDYTIENAQEKKKIGFCMKPTEGSSLKQAVFIGTNEEEVNSWMEILNKILSGIDVSHKSDAETTGMSAAFGARTLSTGVPRPRKPSAGKQESILSVGSMFSSIDEPEPHEDYLLPTHKENSASFLYRESVVEEDAADLTDGKKDGTKPDIVIELTADKKDKLETVATTETVVDDAFEAVAVIEPTANKNDELDTIDATEAKVDVIEVSTVIEAASNKNDELNTVVAAEATVHVTEPTVDTTQAAAAMEPAASKNNELDRVDTNEAKVDAIEAVAVIETTPNKNDEFNTVNATELTVDVIEPTVDATKPTVDATEPTVGATEPTVGATEPTVGATEPTVDATEPTVGATEVVTTIEPAPDKIDELDKPLQEDQNLKHGTCKNDENDTEKIENSEEKQDSVEPSTDTADIAELSTELPVPAEEECAHDSADMKNSATTEIKTEISSEGALPVQLQTGDLHKEECDVQPEVVEDISVAGDVEIVIPVSEVADKVESSANEAQGEGTTVEGIDNEKDIHNNAPDVTSAIDIQIDKTTATEGDETPATEEVAPVGEVTDKVESSTNETERETTSEAINSETDTTNNSSDVISEIDIPVNNLEEIVTTKDDYAKDGKPHTTEVDATPATEGDEKTSATDELETVSKSPLPVNPTSNDPTNNEIVSVAIEVDDHSVASASDGPAVDTPKKHNLEGQCVNGEHKIEAGEIASENDGTVQVNKHVHSDVVTKEFELPKDEVGVNGKISGNDIMEDDDGDSMLDAIMKVSTTNNLSASVS